jgi:hypothetical protein
MARKKSKTGNGAGKSSGSANSGPTWSEAAKALARAHEQRTSALDNLGNSIPRRLRPIVGRMVQKGYGGQEIFEQLVLIERGGSPPWSNWRLSDCGAAILAAMPHRSTITTIDLRLSDISDTGLQILMSPRSRLRSATTMNLSWSNVTDVGLKSLSEAKPPFRKLKQLYLDGTAVNDEGVLALFSKRSHLESLNYLRVGGTRVTSKCVQRLKKAHPGLTIRTVEKSPIWRCDGFVY